MLEHAEREWDKGKGQYRYLDTNHSIRAKATTEYEEDRTTVLACPDCCIRGGVHTRGLIVVCCVAREVASGWGV